MDLSTHRHTPCLSVIDPRGLPVRTVAFYRREAEHTAQVQVTRQCYDAAGRSAGQWDPRLFALWQDDASTPPNQSAIYALGGQVLATDSVDAGWRVQLQGDAAQALTLWDSRLTRTRIEYDALLRPTAMFERGDGDVEQCRERLTYGGNSADDHAHNRCGQRIRHDDSAGRLLMPSYSLAGQMLEQSRQFLNDLSPPDWPRAALEEQRFLTTWQYDALGGRLQQTDALGNQQRWRHDIAGQLSLSHVEQPGTQPYIVLHRCVYDVSGQLLEQTAGNGVISRTTYEPATGRLSRRSAHTADNTLLQDLHYRYDPVGNVVQIDDRSKPIRFFRNQRTDPSSTYTYDTLYQLIAATGREVASATYGPGLPATPDANNLVNYHETYRYDSAGNLQQLQHRGGQAWILRMATARHSNRSLEARNGEIPGEPEIAAGFDHNGNLRALQPGQGLTWNLRNQLQQVSPVQRSTAAHDSEHYLYDSASQRVRKLRVSQAANVEHHADVRYLPGLEIRCDSAVAGGQTLHVITAHGVRLLHWERGLRADQWRYSLTDHLGSSILELDARAALLTEEGYTPFGNTAWWAANSDTEANDKTVRYSGKERDATGLYYYGFRYYAPWLCRWLNPDPAGDVDGLNLFRMVRNNPLTLRDFTGYAGEDPQQEKFYRNATAGFLPPMTGGAVFGTPWERLKEQQAVEALELYKDSRAEGAARLWANNPPTELGLSKQAKHNWKYATPGNPFSGMIDTRTHKIYLIPATHRNEHHGITGQVPWVMSALKKQWFSKDRHLAEGNLSPYTNSKLRNIDHGRAAFYLEGKEVALSTTEDAYGIWKETQTVSADWLGFFIHVDSRTHEVEFNFKSAQLNGPNILLPKEQISFIRNPATKMLDVSLVGHNGSRQQQQERVTQLPDELKQLVRRAFEGMRQQEPLKHRAMRFLGLR